MRDLERASSSLPSSSCLSPPYPYAPFWYKYSPKSVPPLTRQAHSFEAPGTGWDVIIQSPPLSSPTLPLYTHTHTHTKAVPPETAISIFSQRKSSFLKVCRIYAHARLPSRELSTIVVRPIMAFHAFVNDAAEAGQDPHITKPLAGIWLRQCCPPMAADLG
jgi:hypothetical protein